MNNSILKNIAPRLFAIAFLGLLVACASPGTSVVSQLDHSTVEQKHQTVALLGATGMVGRFIIRESLARGYDIRALARTPAKLEEYRDRIAIVKGDARDPEVIRQLLNGSDVVISALGPVKADGNAAKFVSTTVTTNVLREMENQGVSQYLLVSGGGVVIPGDKRNLLGWWIRTLVRLGLNDVLKDKQAEYAVLADSTADWTLVRAPLIDPEPFVSPALVSVKSPPAFRLRAAELARFMVDQIELREYIRQGPFLGSH